MKNIPSLYQGKPVLLNNSIMTYNFPPNKTNLVFWIEDLSVVVDGKFIDSSGNNVILSAATSATTNDSIILPANNGPVISAVTYMGMYSTFYTNPSTPKQVLLSDIPHCTQYNNHFFDEYNRKNWILYTKEIHEKDVDIIYDKVFGDPNTGGYVPIWATSDSVHLYIQGIGGDITIHWNDETSTTKTLSSTSSFFSKTYLTKLGSHKNIRATGDWYNKVIMLQNVNIQDLGCRVTKINNLAVIYIGTNSTYSGDVTNLPISYLRIYNCPKSTLSGNITGKSFTYFYVVTSPLIKFVGTISESLLTYLYILNVNSCQLNCNITNANNLTYFYLGGASYYCWVKGDISNKVKLKSFLLNQSYNIDTYIYGDVTNLSLNTFYVNMGLSKGCNFWGDISGMPITSYLYCGSNKMNITGDITGMNPTYIYFYDYGTGKMNITGDITGMNPPNIYISAYNVSIYGPIPSNTTNFAIINSPDVGIYGDMTEFSANATSIAFDQYLTEKRFTYNGGVLPAWGGATLLRLKNFFTTEEVDNFLINWSTVATSKICTVDLSGNNEPRSSTSDSAVSILQGLGKTIITTL